MGRSVFGNLRIFANGSSINRKIINLNYKIVVLSSESELLRYSLLFSIIIGFD
jgi:hypothetical protein